MSILAVGIDAIEIKRFSTWHTYTTAMLSRIFSAQEITYCLNNPLFSAERFAARFAAKEAFFKALSTAIFPQKLSLLRICKAVSICHGTNNVPYLYSAWDQLQCYTLPSIDTLKIHISLTHTSCHATACVIIEKL